MSRIIISDPNDEHEHIYGMENLHLICEAIYIEKYPKLALRKSEVKIRKVISKAVQKEMEHKLYKENNCENPKISIWEKIVKSILQVLRLSKN